MSLKVLMPVLIALHLVAAVVIVNSLGVDEQESDRQNRTWQVVESNPDCLAGNRDDDLARYWSGEYRQLNAMGADRLGCVNIH